MCFLENENVFYNVRTTKSIFMVLLSILMFSANWNVGRVVEGCQKYSCVGLLGRGMGGLCVRLQEMLKAAEQGSYGESGVFERANRKWTWWYHLGLVIVWVQGEEKVIINRKH